MQTATSRLYDEARAYSGVGTIIGGLVAIKTMAKDLFVIMPQELIRVGSSDIRATEEGIVIGDRVVIPYAGTDVWDRQYDGTCVNLTMDGIGECLIAPATRPEGMTPGNEVKLFFDRCSQEDNIFLQDLDTYVPDGPDSPREKMLLMRSERDKAAVDDDDVLIVLGNRLPIGEMTWAEMDSDDDGNYYLHVVMSDGRYRRVSAGDFSR